MGTTFINGTPGNDVFQAHPDGDYFAGQLVFVLGGMESQGGWPTVNILVNGAVVAANITITSDVLGGHTQVVSVAVPTGVPISSVGIQYTNDLVTQVDDRNVYIGSVSLNGTSLDLGSATYVRTDFPGTIAGQSAMNWNGTMTWSGAAVQNAVAAGGTPNNVTIDAGGGMDTVVYQGRATGYTVGYTDTGFTVKGGAWGTDTLLNTENLLFDDRGPYASGPAVAAVDTGQGTIDGGVGIDTLYLHGSSSQYQISHTTTGFSITGNGVNEWVTNVERLGFTDGFVGLDISGDGGMAYRIYQAAFNRAPDPGGLGYWINVMDHGASLVDVAGGFIGSAEFQNTYGPLDTAHFVTQLYANVLHRAPDSGGLTFWENSIDVYGSSRADVLAGFSESAENQANVIGVIQNGFHFT